MVKFGGAYHTSLVRDDTLWANYLKAKWLIRLYEVMMFMQELGKALFPSGQGKWHGIDRNNRIYIFLTALFPAVLASADSVLLGVVFCWAIISVLLGRYKLQFRKEDIPLLVGLSVYPFIMSVSALLHPEVKDGLVWIVRVLPFLAVWFLLTRLRLTPEGRALPIFVFASGIGTILALLIALFEYFFMSHYRPEGGAGNAAVFGQLVMLFGSISFLNLKSVNKIERWVALFGLIAGYSCAFLSSTRSSWLVMPVHIVILIYFLRCQFTLFNKRILMLGVLACVAVGIAASPHIAKRINEVNSDIEMFYKDPSVNTSVGARLQMYVAALTVIKEAPVLGYGPQNRMEAVRANASEEAKPYLNFTHAHNGFLTVAVDAGLLGLVALLMCLAAPIIAAWKKEEGPTRQISLAIALLLVSNYVIAGSFSIIFGHDALDAIFVIVALMICVDKGSVPFYSISELASLETGKKEDKSLSFKS